MSHHSNSRFYEPNNIWQGVPIMKLRSLQPSQISRHSCPLRPTVFRSTPFSYILSMSFSIVGDQVSHPHKTICPVIFLSVLIFIFWQEVGRQKVLRRMNSIHSNVFMNASWIF
jgi:hypothetical protein